VETCGSVPLELPSLPFPSNRFQVYVAETITIKIDNAEATAAHKILLQKETNAIDIRKLIRTAPRGNPRTPVSKRRQRMPNAKSMSWFL